jgi:hypothetical protein
LLLQRVGETRRAKEGRHFSYEDVEEEVLKEGEEADSKSDARHRFRMKVSPCNSQRRLPSICIHIIL